MDENILNLLGVLTWIAAYWKPLAIGLVATAGVVAWRAWK
jgi:hypothetical protein